MGVIMRALIMVGLLATLASCQEQLYLYPQNVPIPPPMLKMLNEIQKLYDQQGININLTVAMTRPPSEWAPAYERSLQSPSRTRPQPNINPCERGSCYPATGDLLQGRAHRLTASSTFNSTHGIENVIGSGRIREDQSRTWWQSENGVEDVTIQLDLEAPIHFTHLIMTFKSVRPAAMLIERSQDNGETWRVYQYFADNCTARFPTVDKTPANFIGHVVCEEKYSGVEPSTEGEVLFRVLPRNVQITDPYGDDIQSLLKITNLRIRFLKMHENEAGHYAMYEMIVRGSCSCNGHSARCLPMPEEAGESVPNKIHARCECHHNTKGVNCEQCNDMYWDLPWLPAVGQKTNDCKKCNCNNHATSCLFDKELYEESGNWSGGVCNDCMHNTMGNNCEMCKPGFYLNPDKRIEDVDACQPLPDEYTVPTSNKGFVEKN